MLATSKHLDYFTMLFRHYLSESMVNYTEGNIFYSFDHKSSASFLVYLPVPGPVDIDLFAVSINCNQQAFEKICQLHTDRDLQWLRHNFNLFVSQLDSYKERG